MMWKAAKWGMFSLVVALAIVLAGIVGFAIGEDGESPTVTVTQPEPARFEILDEIYQILGESFVDPNSVDIDVLRDGAINGILEALGDPHTVYITPAEFELGIDPITGAFEGIGAQVELDPITGDIVIVTPFRDSPAEKAGIRPGDIVRAVDGETTEGWSVAQAVRRIRGTAGTLVTLTIEHADSTSEEVPITRDTIVIQTLFARPIVDADGEPVEDLAYIQLEQFTEQTVTELRDELRRISDEGYAGLILDLRRNPGGSLQATVDVADMFLDGGVVLTQVDRDGSETVFEARPGGEATDIPMVILIGPGSASGSEVVAGALRDHDRAVLIGQQTFGKGSVNQLSTLSDAGALYVTIARWLTPNGEQIEGVGLLPDITVEASEDELMTGAGPQLYSAIDLLRAGLTQAQ